MRIGFNPNKDKIQVPNDFFHQVIVPVYIPNQEGYFKDSLAILHYCLDSLFKTSHNKTYFTIVNNGSCKEVIDYLQKQFQDNKIHELIHTSNIGKLNAILKGITGQQIPLITITDADVLFLNGWQKATYAIFETFPKAGTVSTTPSSKMVRHLTSNVLFEKGLSKELRFTKVINPEAMQAFAHSVGNPNLYNKHHLDKYLTFSKGNVKAVIGAGHFVATYRAAIFDDLQQRNSIYNLGGNSESDILDKPVIEHGYWRLSTENNYTYHMGNVAESWMEEFLDTIEDQSDVTIPQPNLKEINNSKVFNYVKEKIFFKLINKKPFWTWFLQYKGLNTEASKNY